MCAGRLTCLKLSHFGIHCTAAEMVNFLGILTPLLSPGQNTVKQPTLQANIASERRFRPKFPVSIAHKTEISVFEGRTAVLAVSALQEVSTHVKLDVVV